MVNICAADITTELATNGILVVLIWLIAHLFLVCLIQSIWRTLTIKKTYVYGVQNHQRLCVVLRILRAL